MGGATQPVLTADLIARAIIAAARAYGDDPIITATSRAKGQRRALVAAASALAKAGGMQIVAAEGKLGLARNTVHGARRCRRAGFVEAEAAAVRALSYAAWRPEAAESQVASAPAEPVQAKAGEDTAPPRPPRRAIAKAQAAPPPAPPGPISRPLQPVRFDTPPPGPEAPLSDRILAVLAGGPKNAASLAFLTNSKDLPVSAALGDLERAGQIVAGDIPPEGRRARPWRLAGGA